MNNETGKYVAVIHYYECGKHNISTKLWDPTPQKVEEIQQAMADTICDVCCGSPHFDDLAAKIAKGEPLE